MRAMQLVLAAIGVMVSCYGAAAEPGPVGLDGAKWIWAMPGSGGRLASMPAGAHYFRADLKLPENAQVKSAEVIATADNLLVMW
ncbi:MAG: hypothetical protein HQ567_14760 [Candidatus Nealsonbacteria bacterium]|nr:hypothetical protein [Candidatus Nealsonbacteria bacterium]